MSLVPLHCNCVKVRLRWQEDINIPSHVYAGVCQCVRSEHSQRWWITLVFSFFHVNIFHHSGNRGRSFPPAPPFLSAPTFLLLISILPQGITCIITWLAEGAAVADHKRALVISCFGEEESTVMLAGPKAQQESIYWANKSKWEGGLFSHRLLFNRTSFCIDFTFQTPSLRPLLLYLY